MEIVILAGVVWLAVLVVLFLIGRAITLWYFRINEAIDLLTEIRNELRGARRASIQPIPRSTASSSQPQPAPAVERAAGSKTAPPETGEWFDLNEEVRLVERPDASARYLVSLPKNARVQIVEQRSDGWTLLQSRGGTEGWILGTSQRPITK